MSNEYTPERYMPGVLAAQKATKGKPKSEEWKKKARASWTPERRAALSARMKGNKHSVNQPGHKQSEGMKAKLREFRTGKIFRDDGRSHADPAVLREKKLRYRYHVEPEWYEAKFSEQNGQCALCPATTGYNGRLLSVDHDHKCCGPLKVSAGKKQKLCGSCLRGLLCDSCNNLIGKLESLDEGWAQRALAYLASYSRIIPIEM